MQETGHLSRTCFKNYQWQWTLSWLNWREKHKYYLKSQRKEPTEDCLIKVIWQRAAYWNKACSSVLAKEYRQFFKAMDILLILANDVLQHFHHDQTQKKSQTYRWMNLFQSHVWDAGIRRRGWWKSITGTNQLGGRKDTQQSAVAKWLQ